MMKSDRLVEASKEYAADLKSRFGVGELEIMESVYSREYEIFRQESMPRALTWYERLCNKFSVLNLNIAQKEIELEEALNIAHVQTAPVGVSSFAIGVSALAMIVGMLVGIFVLNSLFFVLFSVVGSIAIALMLLRLPVFLANSWRMRASNQMVLCVFYVVTFMRHTSNLERAVEFASAYLAPPLALDLKKVVWDVEVQKFDSLKDSLERYLASWQKYNPEFVESFHLIESSLYESSEERRLGVLDKALDVMLDGTKEKMLHYVQSLKSPITTLHMLGVVLPLLGLVVLPLIVSFIEGTEWWHIALLYNVVLPVMVFFLSKNILSSRPTGYGDTDIAVVNPELKKYENVVLKIGSAELVLNPAVLCGVLGVLCFFIALVPVVLFWLNPDPSVDIALPLGFSVLGYRESILFPGVIVGPYGLGAAVLSLFFPLSLALSVGLYYRVRSRKVLRIREETRKLEDEFSSALFQLGNRLGDGVPAEMAFPKVAEVAKGTTAGRFFDAVSAKLAVGFGLEEAIGDTIKVFPSNVIKSSMKVLVEGVKRGPKIAAQALLNIARYMREIHAVNERLKDLLADVISDVGSQINFLTPVIAGIVIGITSMITFILGALSGTISGLGEEAGGQIGEIAALFGDGVPTYYFQLVVGVYVFQIVYILTVMSNGIQNGADKLNERYMLGSTTVRSTLLYCAIALAVMIVFNVIALRIVGVAGVIGR